MLLILWSQTFWATSAYMASGQTPTEEWLRDLEDRSSIDPVLQN